MNGKFVDSLVRNNSKIKLDIARARYNELFASTTEEG